MRCDVGPRSYANAIDAPVGPVAVTFMGSAELSHVNGPRTDPSVLVTVTDAVTITPVASGSTGGVTGVAVTISPVGSTVKPMAGLELVRVVATVAPEAGEVGAL